MFEDWAIVSIVVVSQESGAGSVKMNAPDYTESRAQQADFHRRAATIELDVIATASYSPSSLSRTVSWLVKFVLH